MDSNTPILEVKLLVPDLIGVGNLLYPFAKGSRITSSKAILNLKIALLAPSKHSSVAFKLVDVNVIRAKIDNTIFIFFITFIMAIYLFLIYILYKI